MSDQHRDATTGLPLSKYILVVVLLFVLVVILLLSKDEPEPIPTTQPITIAPESQLSEPSTSSEDIAQALQPDATEETSEVQDASTDNVQSTELSEVVAAEPELVEPIKDQQWLNQQIKQLVSEPSWLDLIIMDNVIGNLVVFIDNAANGEIIRMYSPVHEPESKFMAQPIAHNTELLYRLDPESYSRYDIYADMFSAIPTSAVNDLYKNVYELLDQAYQQLGYESGGFHDKLLTMIELLLDTPVVRRDIELVAPSAMFKFVEPELEELLPIQKLLLRMGPANQTKIQAKLTELKDTLSPN